MKLNSFYGSLHKMFNIIAAGDYHYKSDNPMDMLVEWILNHVQPGGYHFFVHTPIKAQIIAMITVSVILILLFGVIYKKKQQVPTGITNFLETFVMYIRNEIAIKNHKSIKTTPLY